MPAGSQGDARTAIRLALALSYFNFVATGAARVVLWGGEIPHDLDLARDGDALRATSLTMVVGDADEFATPAMVERQRARLDAAQVPFTLLRYAGGHRLDRDTLGRIVLGD